MQGGWAVDMEMSKLRTVHLPLTYTVATDVRVCAASSVGPLRGGAERCCAQQGATHAKNQEPRNETGSYTETCGQSPLTWFGVRAHVTLTRTHTL